MSSRNVAAESRVTKSRCSWRMASRLSVLLMPLSKTKIACSLQSVASDWLVVRARSSYRPDYRVAPQGGWVYPGDWWPLPTRSGDDLRDDHGCGRRLPKPVVPYLQNKHCSDRRAPGSPVD